MTNFGEEPKREIKQIGFPNTVQDSEKSWYDIDMWIIKEITKNGEMSSIAWFEIFRKDTGEKVAEIKESVCDIYFK